MKKALFAAIVIAIPLSAAAQPNVQLYGTVDLGVEYLTNPTTAGGSVVKMPNNTSIPSRWGVRGTEDLGGGYSASFVLESGFAPDSGIAQQGGRAFGRQANVSLGTPYGTFVLGRQYTGLFYSMLSADIVGPHLFGTGSLDAYIPNARVDNAFGYQNRRGNLQFGGTFSLGRDVASSGGPAATNCAGELGDDKKACREWSVFSKYDTPTWGAAAAYDKNYGGRGVVFGGPSALNDSRFYDARTVLNGYMVMGDLRVGLGWVGRKNVSAASYKQDLVFLGASYAQGPVLYDAQINRYTRRQSPNDSVMAVARVTYSFSKTTAVYASLGYLINDGTAANSLDGVSGAGAGLNQKGFAAGIRKSF